MKKIFIIILISIINHANAQNNNFNNANVEEVKPSTLNRFLNYDVGNAIKNEGENLLDMPVNNAVRGVSKSTSTYFIEKKLGIASTFVIGGLFYSGEYILHNPDKIENILESYPEFIPTIQKNFSHYSWSHEYFDNIGVGDIYAQQQEQLEQTKEWKDAYKQVENNIIQPAENEPEKWNCNNPQISNIVYFYLLKSHEVFDASTTGQIANQFNVNQSGNLMRKQGVSVFDVNSYYILDSFSAVGDNNDNDHIPSKSTIRDFFSKKINRPLNSKEYENLIDNLTAITVSLDMHRFGRTYKGKNKLHKTIDFTDLRNATIKDLANHYLYVSQNNLNINQFIQSSTILYLRNKVLCLYIK